MYIFHDNNGKIIGGCAADSPDVVLTRIPDGTTALYLDDLEHGHVWSDLGRYQIENGKPVPRVFTAEDVEEAKQGKIAALDAACNATILSGFVSQGTGTAHEYAFDLESQTNLMSELAMLNADPSIDTVEWKTLDSGLLTHSRDQFLQVCRDGQAWKKSNIEKYRRLKAQTLASTTMEQVEAVQWEATTPTVGTIIAHNVTNDVPTVVTKENTPTSRKWFSNFFTKRKS